MPMTKRECVFAAFAVVAIVSSQFRVLFLSENVGGSFQPSGGATSDPASIPTATVREVSERTLPMENNKRSIMETIAPAFFPLDDNGYVRELDTTRFSTMCASILPQHSSTRSSFLPLRDIMGMVALYASVWSASASLSCGRRVFARQKRLKPTLRLSHRFAPFYQNRQINFPPSIETVLVDVGARGSDLMREMEYTNDTR